MECSLNQQCVDGDNDDVIDGGDVDVMDLVMVRNSDHDDDDAFGGGTDNDDYVWCSEGDDDGKRL